MKFISKRDLPGIALFCIVAFWALMVRDTSIGAFVIMMAVAVPLGLAVYFVKKKAGLIPPQDQSEGE
jgi:hypothetical protein